MSGARARRRLEKERAILFKGGNEKGNNSTLSLMRGTSGIPHLFGYERDTSYGATRRKDEH